MDCGEIGAEVESNGSYDIDSQEDRCSSPSLFPSDNKRIKCDDVKIDTRVSFRFVLYRKETFFQTTEIVERGFWCPSISLSKQAGEIAKIIVERKQDKPSMHRGFTNYTGLLELVNRYEYSYITESCLTSRTVSQRGCNATEIADTRFDVENIIYNETLRYVLCFVMKQENYLLYLAKLEKTPESINSGFTNVFRNMDRSEMFQQVKSVLIGENSLKKDHAVSNFAQNDKNYYFSWLNFKSTFFTITSHIRRVLAVYKKQTSSYN